MRYDPARDLSGRCPLLRLGVQTFERASNVTTLRATRVPAIVLLIYNDHLFPAHV